MSTRRTRQTGDFLALMISRGCTQWLLVIAVATGCRHELRRDRIVTGGRLEPRGARVDVADRVATEHPCSVWRYPAYVLTFGILYLYDSAMEAKLGRRCPSTETTYEHPVTLSLAVESSEPRRTIGARPPTCMFATVGEHCVVDRHASVPVPAGVAPSTIVEAVSPDHTRIVAARPCRIVTLADAHEVPIPRCDHARFADRDTLVVGVDNGAGTVLDVDTGVVLGDGDPNWLGSGLATTWHGRELQLIRRDGWTVIAAIEIKNAISSADTLWLVGETSMLVVRPGADPVRVALGVAVDHVLDVRGDIALVELRGAPAAAAIRLSTGAVIARVP